MSRVAIVIVTWNSAAEIGAALDVLAGLDAEVVVVDNASEDSTCEEVEKRHIRVLRNNANRGFAAAVNQGVRATSAPLILLLNPDARLVQGLDRLCALFEDSRVGAAGGILLGSDGNPQRGFMVRRLPSPAALILESLGINRIWPRNPVNWQYRCLDLDPGCEADVDQPAGALLMFSRTAWQKIGGFDERFWPVWFEDVDFCAGLKEAGFRVVFSPAVVAKHTGSHSIVKLSLEKRNIYWYGNLLEYAAKHFRPVELRMVSLAVAIGASLRAAGGWALGGSAKPAVYGRIVTLAMGRLFGQMGSTRKGVV